MTCRLYGEACQTQCQNTFEGGDCSTHNEYCQTYCQSGCQGSCQSGCERSCQDSCERSCESSCQSSCQTSCEKGCQSACQISTQNRPPKAPARLIVPSEVRAGKQIVIEWSQATDPDGNMGGYELQRSINNGAFVTIYNGGTGVLRFTDNVQSSWSTVQYRVRAKDTKNATSSFITSNIVSVVQNVAPVISGQDEDLGIKRAAFSVNYSVDDEDEADSLIVVVRLNEKQLHSVANAKRKEQMSINITDEIMAGLPLQSVNTIEIRCSDSSGNTTYRRYTFSRGNTAPVVTTEDTVGSQDKPFSFTFSATDADGDPISGQLLINGKVRQAWEVIEDGKENTVNLGKVNFARLPLGDSDLELRIRDAHGAEAKKAIAVKKTTGKLWYQLKKELNDMPTVIALAVDWHVADGAVGTIQVCNNPFDDNPTWENGLESVKKQMAHSFTNNTKTGDKWGFGVRIEIERKMATETSWLSFIGGAVK